MPPRAFVFLVSSGLLLSTQIRVVHKRIVARTAIIHNHPATQVPPGRRYAGVIRKGVPSGTVKTYAGVRIFIGRGVFNSRNLIARDYAVSEVVITDHSP